MRALTVLGFGWRRFRRHLALPLAPYALATTPALAMAWLGASSFAPALDRSLHAQASATQGSLAAWIELLASPHQPDLPWLPSLLLALLLLLVGQILVAGGLVETLLEREGRVPFLLGLAKHARRFASSLLWAVLVLGVLLLALRLGLKLASAPLEALAKLSLALATTLFGILLAVVLVPLQLAYDLSRIAAASHGGRRCLRGLFSAWWHVARHPMALVPVYFLCGALALLAGVAGWLVFWRQLPASSAGIAGFFLLHQLGLLGIAAAKCLLWSAEVGYYQAIGEPSWAGKGG